MAMAKETLTDVAENVGVHFGTDGSTIITDTTTSLNITDDILRGIDSFDAAIAAATAVFGDVLSFSDEMGNGFRILQDKNLLVGKRCVFMHWRFSEGDFGVFVSAAVVTTEGEKYIVNDGGAGIHADLMEYSARTGRFGGMLAPNGLRVSEYTTCNGCNGPRLARVETCTNTLHNGSVCGDTDAGRGMSTTHYVDLSA
jgi:hypothetical protein